MQWLYVHVYTIYGSELLLEKHANIEKQNFFFLWTIDKNIGKNKDVSEHMYNHTEITSVRHYFERTNERNTYIYNFW